MNGPTLEQKVDRLMAAVAALATEVSLDRDGDPTPRISVEEVIERTLYPEHFNPRKRRILRKAEFDENGHPIFGNDPRHSEYEPEQRNLKRTTREQSFERHMRPITREEEKFQQVISGRDPGDESPFADEPYSGVLQVPGKKEEADPDTWPYTYLKEFIEGNVLAIAMEPSEDVGPYGTMRHKAGPACKHCKALEALDLLVDQHRQQTLSLLSMIIELGTSKDETIKEYVRYTEELEKQLSDEQQMLISCKADLHDQQKHALGAQCAGLQDEIELQKKMITHLASIAATYTFQGKDTSLGEEADRLVEYVRKHAQEGK